MSLNETDKSGPRTTTTVIAKILTVVGTYVTSVKDKAFLEKSC